MSPLKKIMVNRLVALATGVDIDDNDSNELRHELFKHISYTQVVRPLLLHDYTTGKYKLSQLAIKYHISYAQAMRIKNKDN